MKLRINRYSNVQRCLVLRRENENWKNELVSCVATVPIFSEKLYSLIGPKNIMNKAGNVLAMQKPNYY